VILFFCCLLAFWPLGECCSQQGTPPSTGNPSGVAAGQSQPAWLSPFSLSWFPLHSGYEVGALGLSGLDYNLLSVVTPTYTPTATPIGQLEWTTYNVANSGLNHNEVTCILVDATRRMWFGTNNGLCLYDGVSWQTFTKENSGIWGNYISAITQDYRGRVIVGMLLGWAQNNGIAIFDNGVWTSHWLADDSRTGKSTYDPTCLTTDQQGRIWIGTTDEGLWLMDGSRWRRYTMTNSGLPWNRILSLAFDAQGKLWIGTKGRGYSVFDPVTETFVTSLIPFITPTPTQTPTRTPTITPSPTMTPTNPDDTPMNITPTNTATATPTLEHPTPSSPMQNWVTGFEFLPDGRAWLLGNKDGFALKDGDDWSLFNQSVLKVTPEQEITGLRDVQYDSRSDCTWFATGGDVLKGGGGGIRYNWHNWDIFQYENSGIAGNDITSVRLDWWGHVWFSTKGRGVSEYNEKAAMVGLVSGRVTDALTGIPIPGAVVTISGGHHASTDSRGFYRIIDVPAGEAKVTYAESEGYLPVRTANVSVSVGATASVDFALTPSSFTALPPNVDKPQGDPTEVFVSYTGGDLDKLVSVGRHSVFVNRDYALPLVGQNAAGRLRNPSAAVQQGILPESVVVELSVLGLHHLDEIIDLHVNGFRIPRSLIQVVPSRYRWQRVRARFPTSANWLMFSREGAIPNTLPNGAENQIYLELRRPALVDWASISLSVAGLPNTVGTITGAYQESVADANANWQFDHLLIQLGLETQLRGECFAISRLESVSGSGVADAQVWLDLEAGDNLLPLYFPGHQIHASAVNGPYRIHWLALYTADASATYQLDYTTKIYDFQDFEGVGLSSEATPTPPPTRKPTPTSYPDFTGDYLVNSLDLFLFGRFWRQPSPRAPILDLNPDDWIDELDLLRFLSGWHNRVYPGNGDHNQDGVVDRLDVFAFVNDWKRRNQIRADFNKDGVVDQKDALLFIEAWHTNYVRDVGEPLE